MLEAAWLGSETSLWSRFMSRTGGCLALFLSGFLRFAGFCDLGLYAIL